MLTPMSLPPLTVITGNEELLVERALKRLMAEAGDDAQVTQLPARAVQPGQLTVAASPSLFGGAPVVNVLYSMAMNPPKSAVNPLFFVGILMAACGAGMVLYFRPPA